MIEHVTDGRDIARAAVEVIVNPVNCVGTMGRGLAKHLALSFPGVEDEYRAACNEGWLHPGHPYLHELRGATLPYAMAFFPTKNHWRQPSSIDWVSEGLDRLVAMLVNAGYSSVAIPALGCGLGGLDWTEVQPLIESTFDGYDDIAVHLYHPHD